MIERLNKLLEKNLGLGCKNAVRQNRTLLFVAKKIEFENY